jgi:hypothetical protein
MVRRDARASDRCNTRRGGAIRTAAFQAGNMKKSRTNPIPEKIAGYSAMTLNQHYDIRGRLALETFQLKKNGFGHAAVSTQ